MRQFGFEAELSGGASDVLSILEAKRLAPSDQLHEYHCKCDDCDYNSEWVFRGQEDCTADGEIITKILTWGTSEADNAFVALSSAEQEAGATVGSGVGFHVHVGVADLTAGDLIRAYRLFIRYQDDIGMLARGTARQVRNYNNRLDIAYTARHGYPNEDTVAFWRNDPDTLEVRTFGFGGKNHSWLTGPTYNGTLEFRVWNATMSRWRMRLAVGTSVALVNSAAAGVNVTDRTTASFAETVGPYMAPDIYAYAIRQTAYQERVA